MGYKKERGLWESYEQDAEKTAAEIFCPARISRRDFVKKSGLVALMVAFGTQVPFLRNLPAGFIPVAFAEADEDFVIPGKNGLRLLNDRPINAETPPHLLDDNITPVARHFVRNNGLVPPSANVLASAKEWMLSIDGEVHRPLQLSIEQLQRFEYHTYDLTVECGGNGRAGYNPPVKGNQWSLGAVGCARYGGVLMRDVLRASGLKTSAFYTGYYGADIHLSGDPKRVVISRGTPIEKAMNEYTMIAWEMNGKPLSALHGFPLRVVTPGWPGSVSMKWLNRIWVRDVEHDGPKMTGKAYRVPKYPVPPGSKVPDADMKIIESMPVKSLITFPKTRGRHDLRTAFHLRGHAWAGERSVKQMHVSFDFGQNWIRADLKQPANRYAWQHWKAALNFPSRGYYEVWARATDSNGSMQPTVVPGWNPKGYLNNAMHRIAVTVF